MVGALNWCSNVDLNHYLMCVTLKQDGKKTRYPIACVLKWIACSEYLDTNIEKQFAYNRASESFV